MDKRTRQYNTFSGKRANTGYGAIQEKNVQVNALPPVGSFVVIMEEYTYYGNHARDGIQSFYIPSRSPAHEDAYGNVFVFEVAEYSHGIEDVFNPSNRVRLRHYYGGDRSRGYMTEEVRVVDIAIGVKRLDIVKDATLSSINPVSLMDKECKIKNTHRKGVYVDD